MGIFDFFGAGKARPAELKRADSKVVVQAKAEEENAKGKFMKLFDIYTGWYAKAAPHIGVGSRSEKGQWFLKNLYEILPKDFQHKDLVEYVLNSPNVMEKILEQFKIMEKSMEQPTPKNLKNFENARDGAKNMIDNNFIIAQRVSRYLLRNDNFCKALVDATKHTRSTFSNTESPSPLETFRKYCDLSLAAHAYYDEVCKLGDKINWRAQTVSRAMAP